jgi:hypothetical protein
MPIAIISAIMAGNRNSKDRSIFMASLILAVALSVLMIHYYQEMREEQSYGHF